jgi:hypothetical protein
MKRKSIAELRTISLCGSDLFMQSYNASHRKLSECSHSPASYYSGTESQQSISDRSLYDNVEVVQEKPSSRFLSPTTGPVRNSFVNRSRSFQDTGQCQRYLSPRTNVIVRRKPHDSSSIEDRFEIISNRTSVSPFGSTHSETHLDCSVIETCHSNVQSLSQLSCDKKKNGPFYVKILRRMQKLSVQWRKCKKIQKSA